MSGCSRTSGYACERAVSVGSHRRSVRVGRAVVVCGEAGWTPGGALSSRGGQRDLVPAAHGCSWRQLPKNFPPWETVYWPFKRWRDDGSLDALHDTLRERVREAEGRDPQPTARSSPRTTSRSAIPSAAATPGTAFPSRRSLAAPRPVEGLGPSGVHSDGAGDPGVAPGRLRPSPAAGIAAIPRPPRDRRHRRGIGHGRQS